MKRNKIVSLVLALQCICCAVFAQTNIIPYMNLCGGCCQNPIGGMVSKTDIEHVVIVGSSYVNGLCPNVIVGLDWYDAFGRTDTSRWVSALYTIYFENDQELTISAVRKLPITLPSHEKLNYTTN